LDDVESMITDREESESVYILLIWRLVVI